MIPRASRIAAAAATAAGIAGIAALAHAYTQSRTPMGVPLAWPGGCIFITPDTTPPVDFDHATFTAVLEKSIAAWQSVTTNAGCSYLQLHLDAPAPNLTKGDGVNVVKWRSDASKGFCTDEKDKEGKLICYSPQATAITTVRYQPGKSAATVVPIWDADIELNAVNFTFVNVPSDVKARPNTALADLENTMTHELGHLQGLDHTCWVPSDVQPEPPLDDEGNPLPNCDQVSPCMLSPDTCREIALATMYNFARPGEITKRVPKDDDIAAICGLYPKAKDPMTCDRYMASKSGCAVGGSGALSGAPLVGAWLACVALARRLRARRGSKGTRSVCL